MSIDNLIFQALNGRAPTAEERCDSLNARNTVPGARWVVEGSQEALEADARNAEARALRQANEEKALQAHEAWLETVAHLELPMYKEEVSAIRNTLDERYRGEWEGFLKVNDRAWGGSKEFNRALWMYRCSVQELPDATAQERGRWVRANFEEGAGRYAKASGGRGARRRFDLGWNGDWHQVRRDCL